MSKVIEMKFTAADLDKLPTPTREEGRQRYKDTHPKANGLRLDVFPSGKMSFYVQGTFEGLTLKPAIGGYPALKIPEARNKALEKLNQMAKGINPVEEKRVKRAVKKVTGLTVKGATETYVEEKLTGKQKLPLKKSTQESYKKKIKLLLGEDYYEGPLTDINEDVIAKRMKKITKSQGATGCRSLSAVWNWTRKQKKNRGLIPANPVKLYSDDNDGLYIPEARKNYLKEAYLVDWFDAVEGLSDTPAEFMLFLMLTGVRLEEARSLEWGDIDFKTELYTLPDTKNLKTVELPLPRYLKQRLLKRREKSGRVFPVSDRYCQTVSETIGYKFTNHDLRRTFSTYGYQVIDYTKVEMLTNHIVSGVTADYIQVSPDALAKEHRKVEAHILGLAGRASISNVVPMERVK
jgi:integrase